MRCTSNTSLRPSRSPRPSRTWRTRRGRVGGSCCGADTPACSIGTRRRSTADAHVIMRPRAAQALFRNYLGAKATGVLSAFSLRKSFIPSGRGTSSSLWRSDLETLVAPVPGPPSAVRIPWPFDRVREGQADFLADARLAIADGRHLLAHAPTGIGKTAVALVASLEYALRANKLVLFLTSRQSQHRIAIETVRRIEARGPRIATVDLIAKQSMCLQEGAPAYGRAFHEFCDHKVKSRTCAFFTRDNSAVVTAVLQRTLHVQELVRASGACRVCPHKVAMDAASRANVVVCDYNYLFSEILDRVDGGRGKGRGGPLGYTAFVEMVSSAGEGAVRRGMPSTLPAVAEFLTRWRDQNVGILRLVVPGHEGKFAFRLMDPSVLSKRVFDQVHASVLMSGTLFPAEMYADLLGIDLGRRLIRTYGTPFPKANRLLLVQPELTTLYAKRSAAMHDQIARQIPAIVAVAPA